MATFVKVDFDLIDEKYVLLNEISGYETKTYKKISAIRVYAANNLVRKYNLTYSASPTSGRSLVTKFEEVGSDGTSTLPATTMVYQQPTSNTYEMISMGTTSNNLWNHRESGGYDHGNDNYGPVPGFDVQLGPTYTQASGNLSQTSWSTNASGSLSFTAKKDSAIYFYTYLYSDVDKTINVPWSNGSGVIGFWINGDYNQSAGQSWILHKGYNLVELTAYDQGSDFTFNLNTNLSGLVTSMTSSPSVSAQIAGDFNGDGLTDLGSFSQTDGKFNVSLSTGQAFVPEETWISGFAMGTNQRLILGDFNGDGKTDIAAINTTTGNVRVALSNGLSFNDQGDWITALGNQYSDYYTGDFNGDGLTDIVKATVDTSALNQIVLKFEINTGTSFAPSADFPDFIITPNYLAPIFVDLNGDGLTDMVTNHDPSGSWKIYLNTGTVANRFQYILTENNFGANYQKPVIKDFNYDGIMDIGYYDYSRGVVVAKNFDGSTLGAAYDVPIQFNLTTSQSYVQTTDFNGDGLSDYMAYNNIGQVQLARSISATHAEPDLIQTTTNGLGAQTTIEYFPSAQTIGTWVPSSMPLVKKLTVQNSLGDSYVTTYDYSAGAWDTTERDFLGFKFVKTIDPKGSTKISQFDQEFIFRGMLRDEKVYDSTNILRDEINNEVESISLPGGAAHCYYRRSDHFLFDKTGTLAKRTAERYIHDTAANFGQLLQTIQMGEVDANGVYIGNDDRSANYTYFNNTSSGKWLIGLPKDVSSYDENNVLVKQSWFVYDNGTKTTTPTQGLLTQKEEWDQRAVANPLTKYSYDAYGNLQTTTDAKNNQTTITYDTTCKLFPVKTTNSKNQDVVNEYYGIEGVVLDSGDGFKGVWGQLKSTTDPNNQKGKQVYDTFGRVTKTVSPLDNITYPTSSVAYQFNSTNAKKTVSSRREHNQPTTIDTYEFYDGLGRLIQTKAPSETAGTYAVSGQTVYDNRGLPIKKFLPFFSTNPLDTIETVDNTRPYTTYDYDDLGRLIKTTNPDGTYATVDYDVLKTTTTDENGHKQVSLFDVYGRLIEKQEYTGADGRSPYYSATPFSLYASTKYTYDFDGNLTKTEDAQGNITTITYDNMGRKIAMDDPDMGHWSYEYDANGNLKKQTDAKGQSIDFTYDELNRLTNKTDHAALNVTYTDDDIAVANSKGRLTKSSYVTAKKANFVYIM